MKCAIELNEAEHQTLQQLSLNHRYRDIRTRAAGVLQLSSGGLSAYDVAAALGVSHQSVYNWAQAWQSKGLCGLLVGHTCGRPRALPNAMVTTATQAATAESLTLRQLAVHIEKTHGERLPCGLETLSGALRRAGFSYKRGR